MLVLIQVIISIILTVLYTINIEFTFELIDIFKVLIIFISLNIGLVVLILLSFGLFVFSTQKLPINSTFKHKGLQLFNVYIFNFIYRVKPILLGKENLPENNKFVVYSNHVEYTDPLYIKQVYKDFPLTFLSKIELYKIFFLKTVLKSIGAIPLSRKEGDRQALQAVLQAINLVKNDIPICIFPEGTRSYCNEMGDFKVGSFKIAQKAKADISPIVLFNMHKAVDFFKIIKSKVYLKVLPVIKYEDYKDMDAQTLSQFVHDKIEAELNSMKKI